MLAPPASPGEIPSHRLRWREVALWANVSLLCRCLRFPKSMMAVPRLKYSGGKLASRSDLRVGADPGASPCASKLNTHLGPPKKAGRPKNNHLQIDFCNIRGLNSNINSVHQHLQSAKPHVLALSETKVRSSTNTVSYLYPGYEFYSRFRRNFGVCLYVRSDLSCQREETLEPKDFDVMWFKISTQRITKFICCLYRPPSDTQYRALFSSLSNTIDSLQINHPNAEIAIFGDFNVHNINWLTHSNTNDEQGRQAESFAISSGLTQLVGEPTRIPDRDGEFASLLDLFLTTNPDLYTVIVKPPLGSSDHKLISTLSEQPISAKQPCKPRKIWHYTSAKWDDLKDHFLSFPWLDVCFTSEDPSICAKEVSDVILTGMEAFIPFSKKCPSKGKPWFNKTCERAVASKNVAYRHWRENPTAENRAIFVAARNQCKQSIDQSKDKHNQRIKNKLLASPNGSRSFWSVAKAVSQNFTKPTIPPLTRANGTIATTATEKANLLAELFALHSTVDFQGKTPPNIPAVQSTMPEITFRQRDIKRILRELNTKKASGPDEIPVIVLKSCADELTPVFTRLFNMSYKKGIFPSSWKAARVQPIPKKGKKTLPNNYRPVALLSVISKVMEKAVNKHLLKYLEGFNIISDHQYGFRKSRSTGDLLAYVTHLWNNAIEHFGESRAVALDISKAFDRVWHEGLLSKLRSYGMSGQFCSWLSSFLENRSLQVAIDGFLSDSFTINAGVPQGSILSPTLFLLYINDLLEKTENPIYSFADDSTLVSSFALNARTSAADAHLRRQQEVTHLNKDLEEILSWGDSNQVEFNATKTQAAVFSKKVGTAEPDILMAGHSIPLASSISLLGVNLGSNMSWHNHVVAIAKAASQKLGTLFRTKKLYTSQQLLMLYKAQIRPSLEYCSHVWSSAPKHTLRLLDSIQKRAIRLIGDPELTANLESLEHRRRVGDLALFYRYFHGKCSSDLARLIPPRAVHNRSTRRATATHPYAVQLSTPRTSLFKDSFIWRTSSLWNDLPGVVFPSEYNLQRFKSNVNRYYRTRTVH